MNKGRRKSINDIITELYGIRSSIEALRDEEQESLDNLPDNLQYSTRAERMQEAIDSIEYACDAIDEAMDNLEAAQNS